MLSTRLIWKSIMINIPRLLTYVTYVHRRALKRIWAISYNSIEKRINLQILCAQNFPKRCIGNSNNIFGILWLTIVTSTNISCLRSFISFLRGHIDELLQERRNSSALAMELRLPCSNPSICKMDLKRWSNFFLVTNLYHNFLHIKSVFHFQNP